MAEVVRLLHTVIGKVDALASGLGRVESDVQVLKTDVHVLKTDVKKLDTRMERLETKVDTVIGKVIENTQRITGLEGRVDVLESKAN
jgi:uncharacterized protein YoxC